jgi:hypothetical protein
MFFTKKLSNHSIILKAFYIEDFDKFVLNEQSCSVCQSLMSMAPSSMSHIRAQRKSPSPAKVLGNHGMQKKVTKEKIVFRDKYPV